MKSTKHFETYRLLMTEIKERLAFITCALKNDYKLPDIARYDLCVLELRLISELIGLACLAAHGNIPGTYSQRLQSTWQPGKIFADLQKIHADFYPRPCEKKLDMSKGFIEIKILPDDSFLTKKKLLELHALTGRILHRGALRQIGRPLHLNFKEVEEYRNAIVDQLALHLISAVDGKHSMLVMMEDPKTKNVSVVTVEQTLASAGWIEDQKLRRKQV